MKTQFLSGFIVIMAAGLGVAHAAPKDKLTAATKQLGEKANYSWTTSTKEADGSPGRLSTITGETEKNNVTHLSFAVSGIPVEVYLKGTNGAAKALEDWLTLDEIAQTSGTAAAVVRFLRSYKAPAAQSADLAANLKEAKEENGIVSGELKDEPINEILLLGARRREGEEPPKTSDIKGEARFWISAEGLTKYEIRAQGKVSSGDRTTDIDRTVTVQLKEVGSTKIEIPAGAQQKMPSEIAAGGAPGLVAEYFRTEEGSEDFPNFPANKAPDLKRVDKAINFESTQDDWPGTPFKEFFYIRWTGTIRIPEEGAYTFYLESDDGSRMFIDGKQVLDNGGAHAMEEVAGSMNLTAGNHVLKVEFFEKDIDAGCKMSWKGPKIEKQIVPASVLSH